MKRLSVPILVSFFLLNFIYPFEQTLAQVQEKKDVGYFFIGQRKEVQSKRIKPDVLITAFTREGFIITENEDSPWYDATLFIQGSVLKDPSGKELKEVIICEACDRDGDLNWSVLQYPSGNQGAGTLELVQNLNK